MEVIARFKYHVSIVGKEIFMSRMEYIDYQICPVSSRHTFRGKWCCRGKVEQQQQPQGGKELSTRKKKVEKINNSLSLIPLVLPSKPAAPAAIISKPNIPFYLYTTPPKQQIVDMTQDFYSAGFVLGAIVYFSYDLPKGDFRSLPSRGFNQLSSF